MSELLNHIGNEAANVREFGEQLRQFTESLTQLKSVVPYPTRDYWKARDDHWVHARSSVPEAIVCREVTTKEIPSLTSESPLADLIHPDMLYRVLVRYEGNVPSRLECIPAIKTPQRIVNISGSDTKMNEALNLALNPTKVPLTCFDLPIATSDYDTFRPYFDQVKPIIDALLKK